MQDASAAVHCPRGGLHLIRGWRGEHVASTGGVQHPESDEAAVQWLVAGTATRDEANLALLRAAGAQNYPVRRVNLQQIRMGRTETGQALRYHVLDAIDELLDTRDSWNCHEQISFR